MAEKLTEDLVLEIITRLPLKKAVQCSSLNKNFHSEISTKLNALLSSSSTTVFHYDRECFSIVNSPTAGTIHKSIKLAAGIEILSSCNGVFLLRSSPPFYTSSPVYTSYVFNPLSGGIRPLDFPIYCHHRFGLAVDFPANPTSSSDQYHFKLVEFEFTTIESTRQCFLEFTVLAAVPDGGGKMVVKSSAGLVCRSFTPAPDQNVHPVYANGCLHWLGNGGRKTVALDVENARPRMIDGPVKNYRDRADLGDVWFGFAGGLLHFVHSVPRKVVVHSLDHLKDEWHVAHTILKPWDGVPRYTSPAFFDGRRLFLHLEGGGKRSEIQEHDLASGEWSKSGAMVESWGFESPIFIGYTPTLARVSDVYLFGMTEEKRRTQEMLALIGLQHLVGEGNPVCLARIDALGSHFD